EISSSVMEQLELIEGIRNLSSSIEGGAPEIEIAIDRYRAGLMNVDVNTLISRISEKLQGTGAGQMDVKGEMTDITVKLEDITLKELQMLTIEVNNMETLLTEVATISVGNSPKEVLHNNQNRIVRITADLDEETPLDQIAIAIDERIKELDFPAGYSYRITGEEAMRKESMSNLGFALLLSLILVYMVLASQFESLVHPFTILLTVPLAVVGAVAVFYFQGKAMNIMAVIGIILLVGIAVNDSIILVDAINQFRKEGLKLKEAIVAAGQRRIRPIIMTTLTTILALFPLTLGFGESASLRSPMAWAVIGGLVTSTLLTLIVIPCIYMLFGQAELTWFKKERALGE
ncbi:MAG: efflux RND transporter permease subunit, partial [Bacteroidales bacterium]|nr:efflux RND transporter permease subunit [Bacteroidales bacterium]